MPILNVTSFVSLFNFLCCIDQIFFLTNGGSQIYKDVRRNSLEEAIKVCMSGGLQGIVSEVKAILRNPGTVSQIKESALAIITYGQLK